MKTRHAFFGLAATAVLMVGLSAAPPATADSLDSTGTENVALHSTSAPAVPATATFESDTAVAGTPNFSAHPASCVTYAGSEACFQPNGDYIWVKDIASDGHQAYGDWANDLRDVDGLWWGYRDGRCTNSLGYGHWGYCSKDFYENSTDPNAFGGQGSRISIWAATYSTDGSGTTVLNIN